MEVLKIVCGTTFDSNSEGNVTFYDQMARAYSKLFEQKGGYKVEKFEFAFSKTKLIEKISTGEFNVIISDGTIVAIGEDGMIARDGIGFSTIRSWLTDYPGMKVIIIEEEASKGKAKIGRLFKELSFYNIVFKKEDFKWSVLMTGVVDVLCNPRTAAEALKEYGIEEYDDIKQYLKDNPHILDGSIPAKSSIDDNKEKVVEEIVDVVEEVVEVVEETEDDIDIDKKLDESIRAFEGIDSFEEVEEVKEESMPDAGVNVGAEEKVAEKKDFTFGSFGDFGEDSTVKEEEVVVEEVVEKERTVGPASYQFDFSDTSGDDVVEDVVSFRESKKENVFYGEEIKRDSSDAIVIYGKKNSTYSSGGAIMPARGVVAGVVDYDTIVVEFDSPMSSMDTLDEYRCIVRIRSGRKGMVVDGKYKSANISFDAYLDTVVNERTLMLEVPEFDCEEKREFLEGKECNFIFVKI